MQLNQKQTWIFAQASTYKSYTTNIDAIPGELVVQLGMADDALLKIVKRRIKRGKRSAPPAHRKYNKIRLLF